MKEQVQKNLISLYGRVYEALVKGF